MATVRQIHSAKVVLADSAGVLGEGDALISNRSGLALAIRTADCLPLLLADTRNRAVAAIHVGWRGLIQDVVPQAIEAMANHFGTRPVDVAAAIGPGIGACCFEVGPEVAVQFSRLVPPHTGLDRRMKIDLVDMLSRQMGQTGVPWGQIESSGLCTYCQPGWFHSFRRDRDASGRMVSAIWIR